jgi:hypothetical protein
MFYSSEAFQEHAISEEHVREVIKRMHYIAPTPKEIKKRGRQESGLRPHFVQKNSQQKLFVSKIHFRNIRTLYKASQQRQQLQKEVHVIASQTEWCIILI